MLCHHLWSYDWREAAWADDVCMARLQHNDNHSKGEDWWGRRPWSIAEAEDAAGLRCSFMEVRYGHEGCERPHISLSRTVGLTRVWFTSRENQGI